MSRFAFVYILRSDADPPAHYVGIASNPDERLDWRNAGPRGCTYRRPPPLVDRRLHRIPE